MGHDKCADAVKSANFLLDLIRFETGRRFITPLSIYICSPLSYILIYFLSVFRSPESFAQAKFCSYGYATVEETGIKSHNIFSWGSYFAVNAA